MQKIYNSLQIADWDAFTISHQSITTSMLIEQAAQACLPYFLTHVKTHQHIYIFCGNGNNGSDGLALGRLLHLHHYKIHILLLPKPSNHPHFQHQLALLEDIIPTSINVFDENIRLGIDAVLVDALTGTGFHEPLQHHFDSYIHWINQQSCTVISIDMPSGISVDELKPPLLCVQADTTLTFQQYKLSQLFPQSGMSCGQLLVLDIGLSQAFHEETISNYYTIDSATIKNLYKPRQAFSHKGTFGHALLVCGNEGKLGAAILSATACTTIGAGLTTLQTHPHLFSSVFCSTPEIMCISRNQPIQPHAYRAIALGCGMGTDTDSMQLACSYIEQSKQPLIIDADAITCIVQAGLNLSALPPGSLITPHIKEFDRIAGDFGTDAERFACQQELSITHQVYILMKGRYSCLTTPQGKCFFNTTGNAALAKGGSGDVLTGMITGLYAQYHDMQTAAILGMYWHGLAADIYVTQHAQETMLASDIIKNISAAMQYQLQ